MFPDLGRRLLALLAALPHIVDVALEVAPVAPRLRPHLDLHRRRPRDALRIARVAVAEHHPERLRVFWKQLCHAGVWVATGNSILFKNLEPELWPKRGLILGTIF